MPAIRLPAVRVAVTALLLAGSLAARAADLTVSAAASLTNAFREIAPGFEAQNPGAKVVFNFAASDALLAQIAKGAPVDVFASADQETMDKADQQKLVAAGTRRNFVANTLVVVQPVDQAMRATTLADLGKPDVRRVAIGAPGGVPAGRYAKGALEKAQLWGVVEPKAVFAQNVRQALDYVARGETEAGFVYATDAAIMKDKVRVAFIVPTETPITYPIAAVANAPQPELAKKFVDYVSTAEAQAVLARYGFGKP